MKKAFYRFRRFWRVGLLVLAFFAAAAPWGYCQALSSRESISYGYNPTNKSYYYYALKDRMLYYLNKQFQWVKVDMAPFPATYGFISMSFDKDGQKAISALGSDGYLYELRYSNSVYTWEKQNDVQPISGTPTCLVYFYNPKTDQWVNFTLVNGHFYILQPRDDGRTWGWEENTTVPPLSGDQISMTGGYDKDGNSLLYALADGKLYELETNDDGKTWYWKALAEVGSLPGPPASITFYCDQNNYLFMFALQNGQEYQLKYDSQNKTWHWERTTTPTLQ